jgi:tetratricopeptide (TPR) repeat protein
MDEIPHQSDLIKTTFIVIGILLVLVIVAGIFLVTSKNYIILQPNSAMAYFNRGLVYANKEDFDRAISDWDKAIQLDPNFSAVYYNRGIAYVNTDETQNAIADFKKVLKLCSTDETLCPYAQQMLQKLEGK